MRAEPQAPLWAENGTFSNEKQAVYRKKHVKIQEKMAVGHRTVPCSMKSARSGAPSSRLSNASIVMASLR